MIQGFSWLNTPVQSNALSVPVAKLAQDVDTSTVTPNAAADGTTPNLSTLLLANSDSTAPMLQLLALLTQLLLAMTGNASNAFSDALNQDDNSVKKAKTNQAADKEVKNNEVKPQENKPAAAADKEVKNSDVKPEENKPAEEAENKPAVAADKEVSQTDQTESVKNTKDSEPPANAVNVKDFGAKGDGVTDDQAAIQSAMNEAKTTGKTVWMPEGTYNHSGVLTLDGAKMEGAGDKTVLHATNPHEGAIKLTGDGSSLSNLTTSVNASDRSSMPNAASVLVQNASNATVTNVTTQGATSNGIRLDNATGSKITNNLVLGSNADGLAVMNGSSDNLIQHNVVYQAGDDSFSDNSYTNEGKQDSNNTFDGNLSLDNAYGRGMAFAGSKNATITNNIISGSKWIGIWADTDHNSATMESSGHRIANNTVINSPNGAPVQSNGPGSSVTGTKTDGSVPSLASILGWDPGALPDRYSISPNYRPGTGNGANNAGGIRS